MLQKKKIKNRLLENVTIAQKYPKVKMAKNEGNDCQRGSGSDFLMGMEDAPFGIPMYSQKAATGLCRGQQRSFKDRLDGFVQFKPLDGVNVVREFHTGHKGQVCTDTCVFRAVSATV